MFLGEKLQQGNAPAHILIISKTWFSENGFEFLENWPPISPDINIIQNVWSLLKKRVFQRHLKNNVEFWAFCQGEVWRTPLEYIQNFYSSIPDRINKIVQCIGKKTLNFEFNGFWIYFLLELLLQEILLIVRNFSQSKDSDSVITLVCINNLSRTSCNAPDYKSRLSTKPEHNTWEQILSRYDDCVVGGQQVFLRPTIPLLRPKYYFETHHSYLTQLVCCFFFGCVFITGSNPCAFPRSEFAVTPVASRPEYLFFDLTAISFLGVILLSIADKIAVWILSSTVSTILRISIWILFVKFLSKVSH